MSNLIIIAALAVFAGLGYWRGSVKILLDLVSLLLASFIAWLIPGLGAGLLKLTGLVPQLLCPVVGPVVLGICCYAAISIGLALYLKRQREQHPMEPERSSGDKLVGAGLGILWGCVVLTLVISGLVSAGRAQRAVRLASAELDFRQSRRQQELLKNKQRATLTHQKVQPVSMQTELLPVNDKDLILEPESPVEVWSGRFEHSMLAPVVEKVAPVNPRIEATLRRVQVMLADPVLLQRFQTHPAVVELQKDEILVALSKDSEISGLLTQRRYRELMDHPKITNLLREEQLVRKIRNLDIEKLSAEIVTPGTTPK